MKDAFTEWTPSRRLAESLDEITAVVERYQGMGIRMTLRQLYYQLVAATIIPNDKTSYKRLGDLLSKARMAGYLDWDAIVDRGRIPIIPSEFSGLTDLLDVAFRAYRLPRMEGQDRYIELWVEKDALASVLQPVASAFHVPLQINKGYSSVSAMYEAAGRIRERCQDLDISEAAIVYLGDLDPSGEDMVRDVQERLDVFLRGDVALEVEKLALNIDQVRRYNLPPNPTKTTDSRAASYQHGATSWEVDAIPPQVLRKLIEARLSSMLDLEKIEAIKTKEESDKAKLQRAAERIEKSDG